MENAVNAESEFVHERSFEATNSPRDQLDEAALAMARKWLNEKGTQSLHDAIAKWRVAKAQFDDVLEISEKRASAAQKRADKRHKDKGYTHRIDSVIHPENGDDCITVSYIVAPRRTRISPAF